MSAPTSNMKPLLIELGTEELPVKALPGLAQALFDGVIDGLAKRGIAIDRGDAKPLYTPRRLAVLLPGVATEQPEQRSEVLGPYLNIALDADGQPTKALQGFAAKAGVEGFSRALAREVGSRNITVNTVAPGFIDTDMTRELPEAQREALLTQIPLARLGQAEEIAKVVSFLASDGAAYVTGATIPVNGGMYM